MDTENNCIDRQTAIDTVLAFLGSYCGDAYDDAEMQNLLFLVSLKLNHLPPVTPKQETMHWEFPNPATKMICTCSRCGGSGNAFGKDKFCRNCGAKREAQDE